MGVVSAQLYPLSEHPCRGFGRNTVFLVKKWVFPNVLKSTSPNYCQGGKKVLIKARDGGRALGAERSGSGSGIACPFPRQEAAERSKKREKLQTAAAAGARAIGEGWPGTTAGDRKFCGRQE